MTTSEFWKLIERSKRGAEDCDEQAEKLQTLLTKLPPEEIVAFDAIFTEFRCKAYRWDLWGVAYILCGGCSDDAFDYFRAWLIGRGQKYFEAAMQDPENVARKVTEDDFPEAELLMYAAAQAYESKTGKEMPYRRIKHPHKPTGKQWKEEDLPKLFPIAHKKESICG
jgi:hypothetical protein